MLPLSQLPILLQPLRMCAGVQGCRHGSCTIKAEGPNNGEAKTCCRARSTRTTAPEATSQAKNDNTQNTQHTWAMQHQGKGIGRRQLSFEYAHLSSIGNQCRCVAEYTGASMAKKNWVWYDRCGAISPCRTRRTRRKTSRGRLRGTGPKRAGRATNAACVAPRQRQEAGGNCASLLKNG